MTWNSIQAWMEAHDKLSGWAQTVGAALALLIALWISWREARRERRARRIAEADSAYLAVTSLFFVACEVRDALSRIAQLHGLPRGNVLSAPAFEDVLERLRAIEARVPRSELLNQLFTVRGALLIVLGTLNGQPMGNALTTGERAIAAENLTRVLAAVAEVNLLRNDLAYASDAAKRGWLMRWVLWLALNTRRGRRCTAWLTAKVEAKRAKRIRQFEEWDAQVRAKK